MDGQTADNWRTTGGQADISAFRQADLRHGTTGGQGPFSRPSLRPPRRLREDRMRAAATTTRKSTASVWKGRPGIAMRATRRRASPARSRSFETWHQARIPGYPKAAPGGYDKAEIVAAFDLVDGNEPFARRLPSERVEPRRTRPAFKAWPLNRPQGRSSLRRPPTGHRKAADSSPSGKTLTGSRWWITPADTADESPRRGWLKRQAPKPLTVESSQMTATTRQPGARSVAGAAAAAFATAGRTITKLAPRETPQPRPAAQACRNGRGVRA